MRQQNGVLPTLSAGQSLRWRLPLSISALIAIVLTAFLWAAYREVEATLVRAAGDRASSAANQIAGLLERPAQQSVEELRRVASHADVRQALVEPSAERLAAARAVLATRASAQRRVELWTAGGSRLLEVVAPPAAPASSAAPIPAIETLPRESGLTELRALDDRVFTDSATEVLSAGQPAARLGYVAVRSTISVNPPGILTRLVGSDAVIVIGNRSGGVWTDLTAVVPPPAIDLSRDGVSEYRTSAGEDRVGALMPIRGTPWAVWVEFPRHLVTARARTFLNRMLGTGVAVILLAASIVRIMTGRLTIPMADLTGAAESIASGDYARRVRVDRRDEVGRLGVAFNAMAAEIEDGRRRLEAQVHDRTEALETLRATEATSRAIVELAFDCIISIDGEGIVTEFNPAAERTFGYTRAEVVGRELAALIIPPPFRAAHRSALARVVRTGEEKLIGRLVEMRAMRADGTEFPAELAITAILTGGPPRFTGVVRDISARKRSEQALMESERAYRSIFEEAPVGIAHTALDGRWLRVNKRLCDLLHYSQDELMAIDLATVAHPEEGADAASVNQTLVAGAVDRHMAVRRYRRRNGDYIWVNLTVSLHRDSAGRPAYFIHIIEDLSERRLLEAQLRQAQKMEAVGRLAGGVAHDFNNLLTAILGYTNFVLDDLDANHPVRRDVEEVRKAGESAASLTRQLLAFSRRQVLQPEVIDLNAVVKKMDGLLHRLIGEDISLSSHLTTPLDHVHVDPGQVEQIILNLAVNARDAMPHGGLLTVETDDVMLDENYVASHPGASPGPHVMLAVSDNGTGMTAETMAHVFEPFFTTKARGEGTGLGLATVYGIVKQSGGSIWVYSEPGRGTTFKVYFPRAAREERRPASSPVTAEPIGGTETILVAEDQSEVRALARMILGRHGYTVLEARSGAEALEIVREHATPIDLLLTDVIMPVMSGRELVTELERTHPHIRVLYASGYTDEAIERHGMLDPGLAFLQKPFTPKSLLAKVREVLDAPQAQPSPAVKPR